MREADLLDIGDAPLRAALVSLRPVVRPRRETVGWATVELDRAERELTTAFGTGAEPMAAAVAAPDDDLLGARARILDLADGRRIVLLEPSREGPLGAALARHDEGPLVAYLEVDAAAIDRARKAGLTLGGTGSGPLGPERRVITGQRDGPFLLLVPR